MVLSSFKLTLCTCREREGTCGDEVSNWVDTKERERRLVEEAAGLGRPGRTPTAAQCGAFPIVA
jgi:hypothetical protein